MQKWIKEEWKVCLETIFYLNKQETFVKVREPQRVLEDGSKKALQKHSKEFIWVLEIMVCSELFSKEGWKQ